MKSPRWTSQRVANGSSYACIPVWSLLFVRLWWLSKEEYAILRLTHLHLRIAAVVAYFKGRSVSAIPVQH
ncbi:hypothetical protein PISMIDRAFT_678024 [Pisolithus microcarpus 441]|uniref:Uncharacterized protein n=1 Tax=Pisolithus microcarpus 441 TaxID=765257 RepID=A0A0C9Z638_9AGAM|nr:hypothetical protein PISMIDRAFT_678024 [Pisolithus microcarpus 441]